MSQSNLLRITQINAVYLDNEIFKYLTNTIMNALSSFSPTFTEPEICLLLNFAVSYYSHMRNGSTFGQDMLSIKYKNLSKKKNFFYVILTSLDYVKSCIEKYSLDGNLNNHIFRVEVFCRICSLLNIMSFLRNGTKPRLVERFLALEQVYAHENSQRRFETKYQTRELLWNGFIEILVYILPIINYHKIKRIVNKVNPFASVSSFARLQNTASMSVDTKCVYCAETPILPHHMGCKHIFCYICLKGNQIADSQFECPVCGYSSHNVTCDKFIP